MADILHQLTIADSPDRVYQALTQQTGLAAWWTRRCDAEPRLGSIASFYFVDGAVRFRMRIDALEPAQKVAWTCLGDDPEWQDTHLTFDLSPHPDGTLLNFSHRHWQSTTGIFAMCSYDWARYLTSLKSYLETGRGQPAPG